MESRIMKPRLRKLPISRSSLLVLVVLLAPASGLVLGQQILQYGFENRDPVWKADRADAAYKVLAHQLTDETAHGGQRCEHIQLRAEKGTHIYYTYKVGRAPISEDLNVGLWLKSTRPGVELLCRVVLPRERDPGTVGQPRTVLVRCEPYQNPSRWKLLTLNQPIKRLREQQQLLQAQLGRDVLIDDAYVSELVLNLYDGPGQVDVWIDDLEVGPVYDQPPQEVARTPATPGGTGQQQPGGASQDPAGRGQTQGTPASQDRTPTQSFPPAGARSDLVRLDGPRLLVSGQKFFPIGIRHTGTPLKVLREAGFNTIWLDESTPSEMIQDAVNLGFWLVPTIAPPRMLTVEGRVDGHLTSTDHFVSTVSRFLQHDAVLSWDLGSNLTAENYPDIARAAHAFRAADPSKPVLADVWDGVKSYSRSLDGCMVGFHRWPLMTSMELIMYRDWLLQRRRLAVPGSFCWTWIQNHLPDWFLQIQASDERGPSDGKTGTQAPRPTQQAARPKPEPMGPSPDQVRLLAYTAIGCGYRGLAFWSDRFLADSHTGRDRLLGLALLNQELQMLEPLLLDADPNKEPEWINTYAAGVQAAVLRGPKGVLVLPIWLGEGGQYVAGQGAAQAVKMVIPLVPITAQAWEISPGGIRAYQTKRVLGGTEVTIRNFSLTSAILFTSDLSPTGIVVRLQDQQRRLGRQAAQWSQQEAQEILDKVEQVQSELQQAGHAVPDTQALLKRARDAINNCTAHRRNGEHSEAYSDAQIALRALRVLMRAQWDDAVRNLIQPVASPYGVSYFTLPQHYRLLEELHQLRPGPNALPDGDFETPPDKVPEGWLVQEVPSLDNAQMKARRVKQHALQGKQCLRLDILQGEQSGSILERTFLAVHSPSVRLKPGTLVRITAWIMVKDISGSADGALVYDSVGGEPLAVRVRDTKGWRQVTLYRRVPESGKINVSLASSVWGSVYFDDVRIEPLVPAGDLAAPAGPTQQQRPLAGLQRR
jgi:hypothetical protein